MSDQLNKIERTLGRLEEGILGIQKRLDISNGRIAKNEDRMNKCESLIDQIKGAGKLIHIFWGGVVAIVGIAISIFSILTR